MELSQKPVIVLIAALAFATVVSGIQGQDVAPRRGRKYKAPPATSHIEVDVIKGSNQKPVANAAVIFRSVKNGKDEGNLEVKTNEEGKAIIDIIPTGSELDVQVIADGLATFAGHYRVDEATQAIPITMLAPRAQVSAYVDNSGKSSDRQWGVQEPKRATTPPVVQTPKPTNHTSDPSPTAPVTSPQL